ncbi:MAG TPA: phage tail protein, partial [Tissierellaceae bacterium]|nr:phage tail protein [Tissierellaceae bacterium]
YGANYSIKLGNINEVTFNVPYFIDKLDERVKNENIELIKERMYAKISYNNNDEWMIIDSIEDVGSGDEKYMAVTAFTNVYETSNRKINELNLEVVNPEEYYNAILNDVAWSIGTIDPLFKDIYRSVELSNVTVLEAIITGAETFGAVLDFDTENKKINLMDMDSRAKYRGLNINYSNFLQSINRKRSVDEMTTRLYVYGSEDLSIEKVNPTGMRYLEDFTYFIYPFERDENKNVIKSSHYMSDELAHAILDKNKLSEEYQPLIQAMQEEIDEETIEYINETTLLNELRFDEMSVSGLLDIAKAVEDNDLILKRQGELAEIKTKISIKELTVDHIDATIEDLERQISQLQSQISVTSFSKELYDELSMYIIEKEFRDDRYIDEKELYHDALKKFDESRSPSVVIEASIDNIIDSLEEDYYSDKVVLGDIARVTDKEMNVEMKSLIVEL